MKIRHLNGFAQISGSDPVGGVFLYTVGGTVFFLCIIAREPVFGTFVGFRPWKRVIAPNIIAIIKEKVIRNQKGFG